MQNHHEKARDMARSVLPSTTRRWARGERARIHRAERARTRALLHSLGRLADPDDFEGDLTWQPKRDMAEMIEERRSSDQVGPLIRWATRTVERDPNLASAPPQVRLAHFRCLLPPGVIGDHAITHLRRAVELSTGGDDRH